MKSLNAASTRLLAGSAISAYGNWLTTVALVVLLYQITGSPIAPATYILFRVAPRILGPTPAGYLADHISPLLVVGICNLLQSLLIVSIVVATNHRIIWLIYLAVAIGQILGAMINPCNGSIIASLVPAEELSSYNALFDSALASSIFVAPAIGALLLNKTSPQTFLLVDAATFIIGAIFIFSLPSNNSPTITQTQATRQISAGFKIVWHNLTLRSLGAAYFASGMAITALQAVLIVAATQKFGGSNNVGWLYSAVGGGGIIGGLAIIIWKPKQVNRANVITATLLELVPLALVTVTSTLAVAIVLLALSSLGGVMYQVRGATAIQKNIPREVLGRVNAAIDFCAYLGMLSGAVLALVLSPLGNWQLSTRTVTTLALIIIGFNSLRHDGIENFSSA